MTWLFRERSQRDFGRGVSRRGPPGVGRHLGVEPGSAQYHDDTRRESISDFESIRRSDERERSEMSRRARDPRIHPTAMPLHRLRQSEIVLYGHRLSEWTRSRQRTLLT